MLIVSLFVILGLWARLYKIKVDLLVCFWWIFECWVFEIKTVVSCGVIERRANVNLFV